METLSPYINAILANWQAGAIWMCIFGFIGRLAATPKGRPMAGAWLGILLGPIGVMIAFALSPKQPERRRVAGRAGAAVQNPAAATGGADYGH